ncbi:MAG: hypothetical protein ACTSRI_02770 [Promethearchaeota archaeon]
MMSLIILIILALIFTFGTILGINDIRNYIKDEFFNDLYSGVFLLYATIVIILISFLWELIFWHFVGFPDWMFKIAILAVLMSFFIPFLFLKRICYFFHFILRGKDKVEIKGLYEASLRKWKEIRTEAMKLESEDDFEIEKFIEDFIFTPCAFCFDVQTVGREGCKRECKIDHGICNEDGHEGLINELHGELDFKSMIKKINDVILALEMALERCLEKHE